MSKYFHVEVMIVLVLVSMVYAGYFSSHQGSILNRNGKRSYLLDLVRNEPYDASKTDHHDYEIYEQPDKLSLRRQFFKFNRRISDKDVLHAALMEYLANKNLQESGEDRFEESYIK